MKKTKNRDLIRNLLKDLSKDELISLRDLAEKNHKSGFSSALDIWAEKRKIGCHITAIQKDCIGFMEMKISDVFEEHSLEELLQKTGDSEVNEILDTWSCEQSKEELLFLDLFRQQLLLFIEYAKTGAYCTATAVILEM